MTELHTQELLKHVERRFDDRLDSLDKLITQSMTAMKEINATNHTHLSQKLENLERAFDTYVEAAEKRREIREEDEQDNKSTKERDSRNMKLTLAISIIGWIVAIGSGFYTSDHRNVPRDATVITHQTTTETVVPNGSQQPNQQQLVPLNAPPH